ncbi:hypothetical protein AX15_002038 [Amanita polypyramis BW_CC]|nr:hypothetical protein AX15_002038 [Amanita polypyramis BW_CC]
MSHASRPPYKLWNQKENPPVKLHHFLIWYHHHRLSKAKAKAKSDEAKSDRTKLEEALYESPELAIVGILADATTLRVGSVTEVERQLGEVVESLREQLEGQINEKFALDITLDPNPTILGITEPSPNEPLADALARLPPKTLLTIIFKPNEEHEKKISNVIERMRIDRHVRLVEGSLKSYSTANRKKGSHKHSQWETLLQAIDQLKADNAQLKADNAQLKADNAQLKADNAQLKADNAQLKGRVSALESENVQLRAASVNDPIALRAVRYRVLLDKGREKIVSAWTAGWRWKEFVAVHPTLEDVKNFVASWPFSPTPEALQALLDANGDIRAEGNRVAHEASEEVLREAVQHAPPDRIGALKSIWELIFEKEFPTA